MKHRRIVRQLARLARVFVLGDNEREHFDALLAAPHLSALGLPSMIGEHVHARQNVRLGQSLGNEALQDCRIIGERLTSLGAVKRLIIERIALGSR